MPLELDCEGSTISFPEEEEERSDSVEDSGVQSVNEPREEEKEDSGDDAAAATPPELEPVITGRQPELPVRALRRAAQRSRENLRELIRRGIV